MNMVGSNYPIVEELPIIYKFYRNIDRVLMKNKEKTIFGYHPFVVFRNRLNSLAFRTILISKKIYKSETDEGFVMFLPLFDQAGASIIFEKCYAPEICSLVKSLIPRVDIFIDIGANRSRNISC